METIATRKIYSDFVDYLISINKCKEVWVREEIEAEYKNFQISCRDVGTSGNNFLLAASCLMPPLLRYGSIVRLLFGFEKLSTSRSEPDKCETSRSCPDITTAIGSFNLESGETDDNIPSSRIEIHTVNDGLDNESFKPAKIQSRQSRERNYPETLRAEMTRKANEKDLSVADQNDSWRALNGQNGSDNLSCRMNSGTVGNGSWSVPNKAIDSSSDFLMISRMRNEADHKASWRQPCKQNFPKMLHEISHTKNDEKWSAANHNESLRARNEQSGSDSYRSRFRTNDEPKQNRSRRNEQNDPYPPRSRTKTAADHNSSWRRPSERNYLELLPDKVRTKCNNDLSPADKNGSWRVANEQNDANSRSLRSQANEADQNASWRQPTKLIDQEIQPDVFRRRNKKDPFTADQNGSWRAPYEQNDPDGHSWRSQTNNESDQKGSSTESQPTDLSEADENISWREPNEQNYAYSQKPSTKYEYSLPESDHNPSWRRGNDQNHVEDLKRRRSQAKRVVQGVRPKFLNGGATNETRKLDAYEVDEEAVMRYEFGMLSQNPLSPQNYTKKFHLLLNIEDLHNLEELEQFTIESTVLQKNPNTLDNLRGLYIPENGPSFLIGDRVYVTPCNPDDSNSDVEFEGFVHVVEKQQIQLGFNEKGDNALPAGRNAKFRVRFTLNRRPIRFMHNALDELSSFRLQKMLFPRYPPEPHDPPKSELLISNSKIATNHEQRTAVENIVLGKTPPIYIIFGPPGTGKTVTMVEAICQTYKRFNHNILVCALCNDACDMLTLKLQDYVDKSKMMRVYGASRSWKNVPNKIKKGETNFDYDTGELYMPDEQKLMHYRIIVCTFVTAGRISLMNFPDGYFQRVFVDESGQAFEPECLIAVSGILAKDGKLILAGDPKQLGPIVKSKLAKKHGLQISLLQRLMDTCQIYQKDKITGKYNHQCVTKLVRNYRSHEAILSVSNQHFYDGDLLVCAEESERSKMCGWEWLENSEFPIIFHGVEGQQKQDQSSPSYYNPDEIMIVKDYVNKLMRSGHHQLISAKEIGIVTPYKMQCKKIKEAVATYGDIDVGSVEVFQGQERLIIIISTVRSSDERLTNNPFHHLGFLCDPRRFNVALTRAKALLIIVGNPRLLSLDKYWRSLLKYCMENNAYCGVKISSTAFEGANDVEEIKELFQKLDIVSNHECGNVDDDLIDPIR